MIEHNIRVKQELAQRQSITQRLLSAVLSRGFESLKGMGLRDLTPEQALVSTNQPSELITNEDRTKQLVLRSSALEILRTPIEQLGTAESNSALLRDAVNVITEPYYWLFAGKIPTSKKKLFGRDNATTYSWSEVEQTDNLQVNYGYTVGYTPKNGESTLNSASMLISTQHDPERRNYGESTSPTLELAFSNGKINQINLAWRQERPEALLKLTKNTALGDLLSEVFVFKSSFDLGHPGILFSLGESPKVEFVEYFKYGIQWTKDNKECDPKLYSWFEFRPANNTFNRYFQSADEYRRRGKPTREQMDVQEFMQVLKGTLDLIPTIDLNKV